MSYNIVTHKKQMLIEGIYCISLQLSGFINHIFSLRPLPSGVPSYCSQKEKSFISLPNCLIVLEMIKKSLEPFGLFKNFLPILIFDYSQAMHSETWSVVELSFLNLNNPVWLVSGFRDSLLFADFQGEPWNEITSSSGIPDYMGALIGITNVLLM